MPDCPWCKITLAICEVGAICVKCKLIYSPETVMTFPGYDGTEVNAQIELFILLYNIGVLREGKNSVQFTEDEIIVQRHGDKY